ncbi:hypothetical protein D7V97_25555 [Corallococcus sp. CA053C]|uniref:hypothetical protein n=1 Tax=Corallococcus sp. CA053C TaxID=2316732 RepID=UPI000EA2CD09|nr:hypothetical protein [Corallococcus sp. CA053C]RKH04263.1 hypothetical protein D7V97_25555 [Corallococcus sp. CA053C]
MTARQPRLHRYWIQLPEDVLRARGLCGGCGVTAYDLDDARRILQAQLFKETPLPTFTHVTEDVDVTTLDAGHVLPNMGVCSWRGIWYPLGCGP